MDTIDFLVVGGGVVGLAVCAELTKRFEDSTVILMERHESFGQETSSRNSEVIHSGIYYPSGSLKARLCTAGKELLYEFCEQWKVPCSRLGKLIVAQNEEELQTLHGLLKKGADNGVNDLELLGEREVKSLEPNVKAIAAILSPSTGIIDSHALMSRLETQSRQRGAIFAYGHEVLGIEVASKGEITVSFKNSGKPDRIRTKWLINCAGLNSGKLTEAAGMDAQKTGYRIYPCKGEYFSISGSISQMVSRLIYPTPLAELVGLGIHVTKSLDGRIRLGPNTIYTDAENYDIDSSHLVQFYEAARIFLPFLREQDIQPDTAGIRPKLSGPGMPIRDFVIRHEEDNGYPGLINLVGIESPGLTSCLSIAGMVSDLVLT